MYNPKENQEIYTVTIVRNIGMPISFTFKRSKFLFYLIVGGILLMFLIFSSVAYLLTRSRVEELALNLEKSKKKIDILSDQIAKLDHDRYWKTEESKVEEISNVKDSLLEQPSFSTDGIWITNKSTLSQEDLLEGASVDIDRFNVEVKGDDLNISLRLQNTSNPLQVVGGYVFITLVNRDYSPPLYKSATKKGALGENGYPISYKLGIQYLLRRRYSTKLVKFSLTEVNEYYTDAMVFLYSYKGALLNRQVFPLSKEIFLE